ncbi:hypothetical protein OUZ56_001761 [Daphnia magna]|uniref:Uncharacterized protein n=1 Tax=Daphnia magna TaxID=35525 RepID=A0ABR0A3N2_9CRUS|nr:hypothetical protein OUZ56_001761 [Daphnia magna]
MAKENGLDQNFIPHSSLESCCAHSCSGTFSSFQWNPGYLIIRGQHNFKFDICGLQGGFTLEKREQQCNDYIRCTVGRDKIVLMLGDDSSQVQAIYIDNGFLRKDE